jgi:hypothetical protein
VKVDLNVTILNKLDPTGDGNTAHGKKSNGSQKDFNLVPPVTLNNSDDLDIFIDNASSGGKFKIGLRRIEGHPSLTVMRTCNHWKITNTGTETDIQVDVGPDGQ